MELAFTSASFVSAFGPGNPRYFDSQLAFPPPPFTRATQPLSPPSPIHTFILHFPLVSSIFSLSTH